MWLHTGTCTNTLSNIPSHATLTHICAFVRACKAYLISWACFLTHDLLQARELLGLGPLYVKLVGTFDELALLNMHREELLAARGGQSPSPPQRMGGCVFGLLVTELCLLVWIAVWRGWTPGQAPFYAGPPELRLGACWTLQGPFWQLDASTLKLGHSCTMHVRNLAAVYKLLGSFGMPLGSRS